MGLRSWLKRIEKKAEGHVLVIPQKEGPPLRFHEDAAGAAYTNLMDRLGAGEDVPPEHPLITAARNSSDPWWSSSLYAVHSDEGWTDPVEDLSE